MSTQDRKRPLGPLALPAFAPASLRFATLLAGSLTLAVALGSAGFATASPDHDHGHGSHDQSDHGDHGHGDNGDHNDHGHGDHAHGDEEHAHGGDDHAHGGDDHAHGGDDHAHGGEEHAHGGDDHAHGGEEHAHGGEEHAHSDDDHAHGDGGHGWQTPDAWVERESPLEPDAETLAYGQQVYQRYCSACHGLAGGGDGPAASVAGFNPSPTNLALHGAAHSVGEYAWLIKEGGHASAMPRYEDKLDDEAVWSVVLYIRHELAGDHGDHQH